MRNLNIGIIVGLTALVAIAVGLFFKVQNDQISQLTRIEQSQKREIDLLRKQMQTFTDQELREKSKAEAAAAAAAKEGGDILANELARERTKLQSLIQQRQMLAAGQAVDLNADDTAKLKVLKDDLAQFEAQDRKDSQVLKSVNVESAQAHDNERRAREARKQDRIKQMRADQDKINRLGKQISALQKKKNPSAQNSTDAAALINNQHQFEADLVNLRATEQADQENFNQAKQSYEASTHHTESDIHNEENGVKAKIATTKNEIGAVQHRLELAHQQVSTQKTQLADLDAQIKAQESVIESLSAQSRPALAPTPANH